MFTALVIVYVVVTCFLLFLLFGFSSEDKPKIRTRGPASDYPPVLWCIAFAVIWPLTLFLLLILAITEYFHHQDKNDERVETGKITL